MLWEHDAAGSSPVISTTGSVGPQNRGLTLLIFSFITPWWSFVMTIRTKKDCNFDAKPQSFFHYGVMLYHHAFACIKLRNGDI